MIAFAWHALGEGASADGPVVEIVTAYSPTFVPLPADIDFTGNGLITQEFGKNNAPFDYAIHLNIRGAYDDNIGLTHMNRLHDWYVQFQPSLLIGIGDVVNQQTFLTAMYAPSFYRYDDHSEFDSDQHIARVLGIIKTAT